VPLQDVAYAALLPVLPCLVAAPFVLLGVCVVLPLWIASLAVLGAVWCVVAPLEMGLRAAGKTGLSAARGWLERSLYQLTHPTFPERWRRGARGG
jgi:hypothetical protein